MKMKWNKWKVINNWGYDDDTEGETKDKFQEGDKIWSAFWKL